MPLPLADLVLRWFALPVHPDDRDAQKVDLIEAFLASPERDTPSGAVFAALLGIAETPRGGAPNDELGQALSLLVRGEAAAHAFGIAWAQAEQRGETLAPSAAMAALAAELDALASRSFELSALGLARAVQTHARLWLYASAPDPLAPAALVLLREAVTQIDGPEHRRSVAHAFTVLAGAVATAGRSDLWRDSVAVCDDRHGPLLPRDLAWWIAGCAGSVIARDARWFRARRTREQAEALLGPALASTERLEVDRAEGVLVELAMAYAVNPDLDERPFLDTLDDTVAALLPRLSRADSRDALLLQAAPLALRSRAHHRAADLLNAWLVAAQARGPVGGRVEQAYAEAVRDLRAVDNQELDPLEQPEAVHLPDDAVPGVPVGLYSEDPAARVAALRGAFGGWDFRTAEPQAGDDFHHAVPVLAELYTRGVADPVEAVREAAVVFARRLIYGYSQRDRNPEGMVWVRRVIADTQHLTSPRCRRAYVLALSDYRIMDTDRLAILAANERLDEVLAGNQADYAVVARTGLAHWRMQDMDDQDPAKVDASEEVVRQLLISLDHDEYETEDWPELIRHQRRWLVDRHARAGRWADAVRNADGYLEWLDHEPDEQQLRILGTVLIHHLSVLAADESAPLQPHGARVVRAARDMVALHRPELVLVFDARAAIKVAGERWEQDRQRSLTEFDHGLSLTRAALPHDPEGAWGVAEWAVQWWRWVFLEAEAEESGARSGTVQPYTATTRAAVLYLHHRLYEVDAQADKHLRDIIRMAGHPRTFWTSVSDADVRVLYQLLVPLLEDRADPEQSLKVRVLAKRAAKRGRGWFSR